MTDNINASKVLRWALSLILAAVLMYFSFKWVNWNEFMDSLRECDITYIILSMAAGIAAFFLRAARWRNIMKPLNPDITFGESFDGINIGNISNFIFPRIGEFIRCGIISSTGKIPYNKVLGSVVLERSWDMLTLLAIVAAFFALTWNRFGTFFRERILEPVTGYADVSLWWVPLTAAVLIAAAIMILYKLRETRIGRRIWNILKGSAEGFTAAIKMEQKYTFIVYTVLIWLMYWLMSYFTMLALPQLHGLGVTDTMFLMLIGSIAWIVPVPGAIGAFHLLVTLALTSIFGTSPSEGMAFATLSHESQALTMIICGLICIVRRGRAGGRRYGR